ncbi:MAG TPA: DUF2795 domain-containing protein [Polyangia bacterium]|jgi:hypothetical protein|nr:DUF2795 domain-containing protein [Polyangia bacterium]
MKKTSLGWMTLALAIGFAVPALSKVSVANAKETSADESKSSKEDAAKLKEHNKLRAEITRVKYPASKTEVVSHVKGIKADDKKWFEETLPEKTYESANDVMTALGWEATPPSEEKPRSKSAKGEKTDKTDK